ncbi:hypothetical protein [Paenibacillus sp. J2TS4]|nr:hypothetical protein [Paenibacillus sp. J2TS4]
MDGDRPRLSDRDRIIHNIARSVGSVRSRHSLNVRRARLFLQGRNNTGE